MTQPFNPILPIDGYKLDHRRQYGPGITRVYSNFTPRSSRVEGQTEVVFYGLRAAIQRHLVDDMREFFNAPVSAVAEQYAERVNTYLGPNTVGTDHIVALHALQYLPLEFRALPEGTAVPLRVPMFTVENTHDGFAWLTNYFETVLSSAIWGPCTSATTALRLRLLLDQAAHRTGADPAFVPWQGHDFSMRGMMGIEAAAISGSAHLLYFTGTDTIPALDWIERYYPSTPGYFLGGSVPATEHSVMCAGTSVHELETFQRILDLYPAGIVSVVSDTWDLWRVLMWILPQLKERIMARDGKLVIRPDSGDPVKIICGDSNAEPDTPEAFGVMRFLWSLFGGTTNNRGFKVLDSHIGCIYGDSINYERAQHMMNGLEAIGFASSNIVLGVGSYSYQYVTRDTYGFAMKATNVVIDGKDLPIYKRPVTDSGEKTSALGYLVVRGNASGVLELVQTATRAEMESPHNLLQPVWRNGQWLRTQSFEEVRRVASEALSVHPQLRSAI